MKKATRIQIICIVVLLIVLWLFTSCKSKTVYVPIESVKTEYRNKLVKDSVHILDSVFLYSRNDTVFLNKYRFVYKDKLVKDTVNLKDTIHIPYPVKGDTIEVNKLKWYQEACIWFTSLVLVALALYLGVKYRGVIFSFFRKLIFKI
ncbi:MULTISPECIES: hypothetical protein [Dysgonomonas]|uniref:hypothetical protein n=1 Tax=Dysgonomonas TaxID=156973 RepID=UPI00092920A2|nr:MULTISPECIES: hypothetical protein [Dysgonomonas]MBN9303493.1 hypothetical protein [Dysgonomonas mossii]OJX60475.1 MAG: hypothetical protein BGO84_08855 [Dysgonomonas sp. 37-18]